MLESIENPTGIDDDPGDNSKTQQIRLNRLAGDVNGDGKVDVYDLFDLSKAYGSELGDSNWNPNCDFNKVDASDLSYLAENYGISV